MELLHKKLKGIQFDLTKELECAICLELLVDPVITKCNHQFCRGCLRTTLEKRCIKRCPMCNEVLSKRSMIESATLKPLIRDLKLLLTAMESDFDLQQDIKVASEPASKPFPAIKSMAIQSTIQSSESAEIHLDKSARQPMEAGKKAPTLLTQISEECKQNSIENAANNVSAILCANATEASATCSVSLQSIMDKERCEKPKGNAARDKETTVDNLEVQQPKHGHHPEDDAKSPNTVIEIASCKDDGTNTSSQSTIELVIENKPPVAPILCASICATSKVENWLMNRCIQDSDSPVPLGREASPQDHTAAGNDMNRKTPGKIFKSRLILDRNKCISSQNKERDKSSDPYNFISSQKVYPKVKKRQTRQGKHKSKELQAGSKFADLLNLRKRKNRAAKEKATRSILENAENKQELQSQPFPNSCLVNMYDKFDEFLLNGVTNKQADKPPVMQPVTSELWNDEDFNVFLTPANESLSLNQEKENLINKPGRKRKIKPISRGRKNPKCKENNYILNHLRSEIMQAEQHELVIEVQKPKLRSNLNSKNPIVPRTGQNASLLSLNKHCKIMVKAPNMSREKASTDTEVEYCKDEQLTDNDQAPSVDNIVKEKQTPLNVKNCEQKQFPEAMASPSVSPTHKQQVKHSHVDGQRGGTPSPEICKDASGRLVQIPNKENELPFVIQMSEENTDKQIAPIQKSFAPTSLNMKNLGDEHHPIDVDDFPIVPKLDALEKCLIVQKGAEKQTAESILAPANDLDIQNIEMEMHQEIMEVNTDNPTAHRQNCLASAMGSSVGKLGKREDPQVVDIYHIAPREDMEERLNVKERAESPQISEVNLNASETPKVNVQMQEAKIFRTNVDIQTTPLQKNMASTYLNLGDAVRKQHPDSVGKRPHSLDRELHVLNSTSMKDILISKRLTDSVPESLNVVQKDTEFSKTFNDVTATSNVTNGKVQWQYFGQCHGKSLFPFVKLGNLYQSLAGLRHSVSCQTEPSDQVYQSFGISYTSDFTNISSIRYNDNSRALNICSSVGTQTVPDETLVVKCQHCLSGAVSDKCTSTLSVTNGCKKNGSPVNSLEAKLSDSQCDTEVIILPSQDTPYLDAKLIGLYKMENFKNVLDIQAASAAEKRFGFHNNSEIEATGSFDMTSLISLSKIGVHHSLEILAPETCTDCGDDRARPVTTSKFEDDVVPESGISNCIPKIIAKDNTGDLASSQVLMEDDVVPPTPTDKASGAWRRSPGVNPSGSAAIVSQKRKRAQVKMISYANKKAKREEAKQNAKPIDFDESTQELDLPGSGSCQFKDDDEEMAKVLANINLDLARATVVKDEDEIDEGYAGEITLLEAMEHVKTMGNGQTTPEFTSVKDAIDTEMSEEIFGVGQDINAKIVNVAKMALTEIDQVHPCASSKFSNHSECDAVELLEKDPFSTNEEFAMENGFSQSDDEFKSLDWKDLETEEDFGEAFPRNEETTTVEGIPHSEQSTVSTLQTFPSTQQREILKKDIENDKQQLKEIEMLLAKKQHCNNKPYIEKIEETKSESKAEKTNTFEFDSEDGLEECLMDDDDSVHVPEQKSERAGSQIASLNNYSWDPDFVSWDSQDKAVNKLTAQKKQSAILQMCLPKVDTSPTVPTPPKVSTPKYSLVASGSSASEQNNVQLLATQLKGSFHSRFNDMTTHVIVKLVGNLCERTLKYVLGISAGCWIVNYKWVTDSLKAGKAMPEINYEVVGDTNEGLHNGPRKARTNLSKPLLTDYEICLVKPFTELTEDQLKSLLHYSGATYISDPENFSKNANSKQLVICENQFHTINEFHGLLQKNKVVTIVSRDWLLDSIASYSIKPTKPYTLR